MAQTGDRDRAGTSPKLQEMRDSVPVVTPGAAGVKPRGFRAVGDKT